MLYLHDVRVLEPGHHPGLVQEPVQPPLEIRLVSGGLRQHRHVLLPHGQVRRQVLLDGHRDIQGNIPAQVRDAEAAVPQYPVELEVLYPGALRQGQAVVGGGHGEALLSGSVGGIMDMVGDNEWLQVPGCCGW